MFYKTKEEIEIIRQSCHLVCKTLALVGENMRPGMTGQEIDKLAEEFIRDHGATPAFKGYRGFKNTLCVSINEQVVHGIPSSYQFNEKDIVSVDCGVQLNGYFGDSAYTFIFNEVEEATQKLCAVTKTSLYLAINEAVVGKRIGDIGYAVQSYAEVKHRYGIVRELTGHGIGKNLHETPDVPNYGKRGQGSILKEGLVIAIEPMVNRGTQKVTQLNDGWTIVSKDKAPSAHYEHTVAIQKGKADILSDHSYIEAAIKNNKYLTDVSIII
jgi:methionyl aminopeptidase